MADFAQTHDKDYSTSRLEVALLEFSLPPVGYPARKWKKPRRAQPEPAPLSVVANPAYKGYRAKLTVVSPGVQTLDLNEGALGTG